MDDLDREIEEAARDARRKVRRRRLATVASTATFLIVGGVGMLTVFHLFPEPDVDEFEAHRQAVKARHEEPSAQAVVDDFAAANRDRSRTRWKVAPVVLLAFASAILVSKQLRPEP